MDEPLSHWSDSVRAELDYRNPHNQWHQSAIGIDAQAQDYVQRTPTRVVDNFAVSAWCREMTAADLGLFWTKWVSDAPYSFWLGADHG